ncbi:MAG: DUF58 domain-containing protein [Lachnospiraceae bacterium]|jgi:uncharacterized protein (DUF58 family)
MEFFLILAGAGIVFLLERFVCSRFWDKGLSVSVRFPEKPAEEGDEAVLTEVIENRKILPLPWLNVKFRISRNLRFSTMENTSTSDWNYKSDVFSILSGQRITRRLTFGCGKRGYYTIGQADCISADLLMTSTMVRTYAQHTHFYVYPKAADISSLDIPFRRMIGTVTARQMLYEDPFEFRGLRDYAPTDPMSRINWKATARTGQMLVNLHDSTASREAVIFLNVEDETVWQYSQLHEEGIRLASALCRRLLAENIPTRLYSNGIDMLTGSAAMLPAGSGNRQMDTINELLARIDLTQPCVPGIRQVKEADASDLPDFPLFIMISSCQREDLAAAFRSLCAKGCSGLWIAPLHADMPLRVAASPGMDVIRWEVEKNA